MELSDQVLSCKLTNTEYTAIKTINWELIMATFYMGHRQLAPT